MIDITNLNETAVGTIFSWSEVSEIHRVRNGIYHRHGKLISLLTDFGRINPCYPDTHDDDQTRIFYTGSGRHGDQTMDPANRALIAAVGTNVSVPLFNKLSVGRWEFTGFWTIGEPAYIFDERADRMIWRFTLERA
ncbi:MAG: hypothetical protein ACR2IH_03465 [Pyrinomonadaceae bacterium]